MAMDILFKGIQQVMSLPSNPEKGVIYLVGNGQKGGNGTGIYFGTRWYGKTLDDTAVKELITRLSTAEVDITTIKGQIGDWVKDMGTIATVVSGHDTKITSLENALKEDGDTYEAIKAAKDAADAAQGDVDALEKVVATKANQSDLDTLAGRVTTAETDIDNLEKSLGAEGDTGRAIAAAQKKADDAYALADAAQTADEVSSAIETKISGLKLGDTYEAKGTAQDLINGLGGGDDGTDHGVKVTVASSKGEVSSVDVEVTGALSEFVSGDKKRWDDHLANTGIHVTAQQKQDWQDATDAINAFLDDNATTDNVINTLKEIQEFLTSDDGTVETLLADVKTNADAIDALEGVVGAPAKDETPASGIFAELEDLNNASHTHSNKALLDTYAQTEADLADAVSKKHEHTNKTELDKIADGDKKKWDDHVAATDIHVTTTDKEKWNSVADRAIRAVNFENNGEEYIQIDLADDQTDGTADGHLFVSTSIADIKETEKKLADAYAVKSYVDSQISTNAIYYGGDDAE